MRLFLLFLSLVLAVRLCAAPSVSGVHEYSGNFGPWGSDRWAVDKSDASSIWNEGTRTLAVTVTFSASSQDNPNGSPGRVTYGTTMRSASGVGSDVEKDSLRFSGGQVITFQIPVPVGQEVRIWIHLTSGWNDQTRDNGRKYSGWFSGDGTQYRRLDFSVTAPPAPATGVAWARAVCVWGPVEGAGMTDAQNIPTLPRLDAGASMVCTHYVRMDDSSQYYAGVIDFDASKVAYGGNPLVESYERVDGSSALYYSGAVVDPASKTPLKSGTAGTVVSSLNWASSSGSTSPTGSAIQTPINAANPGKVADGGTGPATGKEITDAANAQIGQAHADAAALQRSVDGVGSKIDALGSKLGTGTTGGIEGGNASNLGTGTSPAETDLKKWDGGTAKTKLDSLNPLSGRTIPGAQPSKILIPFSTLYSGMQDKEIDFGAAPLAQWVPMVRNVSLFFVSAFFLWASIRLISKTLASV